jgi:hypothetical protein
MHAALIDFGTCLAFFIAIATLLNSLCTQEFRLHVAQLLSRRVAAPPTVDTQPFGTWAADWDLTQLNKDVVHEAAATRDNSQVPSLLQPQFDRLGGLGLLWWGLAAVPEQGSEADYCQFAKSHAAELAYPEPAVGAPILAPLPGAASAPGWVYTAVRYDGLEPDMGWREVQKQLLEARAPSLLSITSRVPRETAFRDGVFCVAYDSQPRLVWDLRTPWRLYDLYSLGFRIAQGIQSRMPEILFQPGYLVRGAAYTGEVTETIRENLQSLVSFPTLRRDQTPEYILRCNNELRVVQAPPEAVCAGGLAAEVSLYVNERGLVWNRIFDQPIAVGVFFLGSFCVTIVFYAGLLIFMGSYSVFRLIASIAPHNALGIFDKEAVRDNSVTILLSAGGLVVSLLIVIFK